MTKELVQQLRRASALLSDDGWWKPETLSAAADEIERLAKENLRLLAGLKRIADEPLYNSNGKLWCLVAAQETLESQPPAHEPGVHLHDEGDAVSCALHVDIASDNEATVLAARKKIVDFILDSPATGEFMVTVLDAKRCPTLKSGDRYWMCSCNPPGEFNTESVSICKDCGTVRPPTSRT